MPETPAFLAERLKTEGEKTAVLFASLTDPQWQATVYTEGAQWSVRHVLAHFVMAEKSFIKLFANIRDGGTGVPEDFDLDRQNAKHQQEVETLSPQELLQQFQAVRAEMVVFVAALSAGDLETHGRHPFLGVTTLAEMIKLVYRHNQIHARDLRSAVPD
jgi:uncharacterized damage-inducible protein DinB